jgi:hypothetical protein
MLEYAICTSQRERKLYMYWWEKAKKNVKRSK